MTCAPLSADRYAVLGNPVAHSRSPWIHAAFAQATGQSVSYGRVLAPMDAFSDTVRQFAAEGGRGCNITVPFKFEAFALCPRHSTRAQLAQAANTLRFDAEGWWADNTDGIGLVRDIEHHGQRPLRGTRVLLVGAGGASAGVLGPLLQAGPASLRVVNRSPDKAQALVERHQTWAHQHGVHLSHGGLADVDEAYEVVINGSASSLSGSSIPVADRVLAPGSLALDMMYGPAAQPFLQWAQGRGAVARDGLGMLVEQAAEAFWVWRGVRPETTQVLAELRAALHQPAP
ncbi:MAG: shikimate dehydrogenase [Ideonella sp. MAG2]|nr:MAG: shikimate dehydrogenase [Ideonella sp. MAG2]